MRSLTTKPGGPEGKWMTKKADFNAVEWSTLVEGPLLAGMRVITAGRGGPLRQSLALGQPYAQPRRQHGESELLAHLVSAPAAMDPSRVGSGEDISAVSTPRLREAVRLLD